MKYAILFVVWIFACAFVDLAIPNIGATWHMLIGYFIGIVWMGASLK